MLPQTLSCTAGEGGPGPHGWVGEGLRREKMSPCADGTVVAAREGNPVDLVDTEEADSAMFFADPEITFVVSAQAISYYHHFSLWEHVVDPTIEERSDLDGDPELLANLPREAAFRGLPGLQAPSW